MNDKVPDLNASATSIWNPLALWLPKVPDRTKSSSSGSSPGRGCSLRVHYPSHYSWLATHRIRTKTLDAVPGKPDEIGLWGCAAIALTIPQDCANYRATKLVQRTRSIAATKGLGPWARRGRNQVVVTRSANRTGRAGINEWSKHGRGVLGE